MCLDGTKSDFSEHLFGCVYKKSENYGEYSYAKCYQNMFQPYNFVLLLRIQSNIYVILVFPTEFIQLKEGKFCNNSCFGYLKNFTFPSEDLSNDTMALNACESYCSVKEDCWGCSRDCRKICHWTAIPDCKDHQNSMYPVSTAVSQKPGSYQ